MPVQESHHVSTWEGHEPQQADVLEGPQYKVYVPKEVNHGAKWAGFSDMWVWFCAEGGSLCLGCEQGSPHGPANPSPNHSHWPGCAQDPQKAFEVSHLNELAGICWEKALLQVRSGGRGLEHFFKADFLENNAELVAIGVGGY